MNRIAQNTPTTTPIPMPGRLSVWNDDQPFATLDEVAAGVTVYTVGTITHIRYLDTARVRDSIRTGNRAGLGRAMAVISDGSGNSAHVYLHADVTAQALPALVVGMKVSVSGVVFHTVPSQPAGINARSVRTVSV
ncbi:hypothetical protein [Streptomyces sp. AS02]|uniref:hypothetical protein n=1 Tax=Streptomyces sp. AS02 TaxID=2938946 RepID=UPI002021CB0C|nr:hypothetical protein [Streptomyces sp. AS02]MCL8016872.1 hypothetical protein [Streptomyces sp. AS02]